MKSTTASEIMTKDVITVGPQTLLTEVALIFSQHAFHHIPVLNQNHEPLGIISKSDFLQLQHHFTRLNPSGAKEQNEKLFNSLVSQEVMTANPQCIAATEPIDQAAKIFMQNEIHSLLVCSEDGRCIGILTPLDLLRFVFSPTDAK